MPLHAFCASSWLITRIYWDARSAKHWDVILSLIIIIIIIIIII